MKTFRFALATAFVALSALPALAEKISLADLSAYFNGITTAQAGFEQLNGDGSRSTGTLYLNRPGRMRFEYDAPNDALVLAGGGAVAIFDNKSNQPPEQYPLKRTPLNLILERNVDLTKARMVVSHTSSGDTTTVVAQDPENPDYGTISLIFSNNPVRLRGWVVTDGGGGSTRVTLSDLTQNIALRASLFNIEQETMMRTRSNR